ncbi:MAG: oxaloacetate decarboxylase [Proteobacteria bacterium]|nr:oxaloacetate decarboxylase [Pseudomonadota bacterium]
MTPLDPLLLAGLQLMLAGMGTVFLFLTLLVFAVKLMSFLVVRFAPQGIPENLATASQTGQANAAPAAHVVAIAAAIDKHRNRQI